MYSIRKSCGEILSPWPPFYAFSLNISQMKVRKDERKEVCVPGQSWYWPASFWTSWRRRKFNSFTSQRALEDVQSAGGKCLNVWLPLKQ